MAVQQFIDKIHLGDCRNLLPQIPAESVHLCLSDIPYGIGLDEWDILHRNKNSAYLGRSPAQVGKNFVVDLHDYYSGVTINSVNIAGGNKVEFHPLGIPYDDKNGSPIATTGIITIGYAGLTRTIEITPNTGRISIP